jgi:hypothetical protein
VSKSTKIIYYIDHVLEDHLLEHDKNLHEEDYFCFQQDSVSSHRSKRSQKWLKDNFPGCLWDYFAWKYTLAKLDCTKHKTLAKFKIRLTKIREKMPQKLACRSKREVELL